MWWRVRLRHAHPHVHAHLRPDRGVTAQGVHRRADPRAGHHAPARAVGRDERPFGRARRIRAAAPRPRRHEVFSWLRARHRLHLPDPGHGRQMPALGGKGGVTAPPATLRPAALRRPGARRTPASAIQGGRLQQIADRGRVGPQRRAHVAAQTWSEIPVGGPVPPWVLCGRYSSTKAPKDLADGFRAIDATDGPRSPTSTSRPPSRWSRSSSGTRATRRHAGPERVDARCGWCAGGWCRRGRRTRPAGPG